MFYTDCFSFSSYIVGHKMRIFLEVLVPDVSFFTEMDGKASICNLIYHTKYGIASLA